MMAVTVLGCLGEVLPAGAGGDVGTEVMCRGVVFGVGGGTGVMGHGVGGGRKYPRELSDWELPRSSYNL